MSWRRGKGAILEAYKRISPIRDPIHDYLSFSIFEREIIDSPYFQRLHFVLQNSAAYTTYPSNKNSRYIHSLGVSHLCGRIFIHALKNSHPDDLTAFLSSADAFIRRNLDKISTHHTAKEDIKSSWYDLVGNGSRFLHNPLFGASPIFLHAYDIEANRHDEHTRGGSYFPAELIVNTLWIALKICGLLHDIGHLPMSHLFEDALDELGDASVVYETRHAEALSNASKVAPDDIVSTLTPDRESWKADLRSILSNSDSDLDAWLASLKFHEARALKIVDIIRRSPPDTYERKHVIYRDLIFFLAQVITFASSDSVHPNNRFLVAIKSIIASELDADRLDYTMRDPASSGLELGVFDANRIVSSFTLTRANDIFQFSITEKSISAVENFFHQRYLNYKTLIYHRTAIKYKAVLREILVRLILFSYDNPQSAVAATIAKAGLIELDKSNRNVRKIAPSTDQFLRSFDDARLRTCLFDLLEITPTYSASSTESRGTEEWSKGQELRAINTLIQTFLYRKAENIISYGKGHAAVDAESSQHEVYTARPHIIGDTALQKKFKEYISELKKAIYAETDGQVTLLYTVLKPRIYNGQNKPDDKIYVAMPQSDIKKAPVMRPLEDVSPYIRLQPTMARDDQDYAISFVGNGLKLNPSFRNNCDRWYGSLLKKVADLKDQNDRIA